MWAFVFKMAKTYYEKLKDPRWQKKRLEVFERDGFACTRCDDKESTLNVHHWSYSKNGNPWDSDINELDTVCNDCHENIENMIGSCKYFIKNNKKLNFEEFIDGLDTEEQNKIGYLFARLFQKNSVYLNIVKDCYKLFIKGVNHAKQNT
jgi:5-methylcytosine-specific restriction endonuclease McrA